MRKSTNRNARRVQILQEMLSAFCSRNHLQNTPDWRKIILDLHLWQCLAYAVRKGAEKMTASQAKKEIMRRALSIEPTVHVGKDGIDQNLLDEVVLQLKKRRIIKIRVLNNAESETKDVATQIADATGSVAVDVRGGVIILTDKRTWDSQCQKKSDN